MDRRTREELRAVRWPLALVVLAALVAGLATLLDRGGPTARDYALVLGAPALYVVLPLALGWLVVGVLRHRSRRR